MIHSGPPEETGRKGPPSRNDPRYRSGGGALSDFTAGKGTKQEPYLISNGSQLAYMISLGIESTKGKYYKITEQGKIRHNYLLREWDSFNSKVKRILRSGENE